ncbi:MAG: hypothetical protein IPN76_12195 [Saprospiraceae bacterium]|nr:hypothetical protein [Saprospiraceae bacterium]
MAKKTTYTIDIKVDGLTNSIQNTISGDSFETEVLVVSMEDISGVTKANGWKFDWKTEFRLTDRTVYKLSIVGNPTIIQGLASISNFGDHFYLHLVESAPFNLGRKKLYEGVPGNLFAFACKLSWDNGNNGIVAFQSKTKLIEHYENTLGATHIGGHKMIIFPDAALKLIRQYFKT